MARKFQLTGSVAPGSRIDRVEVEAPTGEQPYGKVLVLDGEAVELDEDQVAALVGHVNLREVHETKAEVKAQAKAQAEADKSSTEKGA